MIDRIERFIAHLEQHRDPASIPESSHAAARVWVQDSIGVALAGTAVAESQQVLAAVQGWGRADDARVWGTQKRLPASSAAMVNAFHIHNQEFDCVHEKAVVHPMAVILAALLTAAEKGGASRPVSGPQLTAALALAVDVATVTGMCAKRGIRFFRPAQCGCIGATAGLCVLLGLNTTATRDAFGIAYSQLAGTMQAHIEGTPTLALQVGFAARAAINAVDLAAQGFRGPHHVLDGPHGYFNLFEPDGVSANAADTPFNELGKCWQIERVSHKPFPTGRAAQGGIAGLRSLMKSVGFSSADVERIIVFAPPLVRQLVDRPMQPDMSVSYARLCMPFLLATTMRDGNVGLDAYSPERLSDADLLALAPRVSMAADTNNDVNALRPQRIEITLKGGAVHALDMPYVYGAPEAPMSSTEREQKFLDCCAFARAPLSTDAANTLQSTIDQMATLDDVSLIVSHCIPT